MEPGAVGQVTDFKESNKRLEWGLKKAMLNALRVCNLMLFLLFLCFKVNNYHAQQIVGGSEHTLRAKLTFSQESHGMILFSTEAPRK